jgi:nicotinamide-nucleotide amidase
MLVEGAYMLSNDRGTAPGQWIEDRGTVLMMLPGPPHELKSMFTRHCVPRLERLVPQLAIRTLELRISGMSESELDQAISPIYKHYSNPVTTILAHNGDMQVHLRARCSTEGETMQLLAEVGGKIDAVLGDRIYSRNGDPLEAVVGKQLVGQHATLAVAESATGGGLGERITGIAGSSAWFAGGIIAYSKRMKIDLLGVPAAILDEFGTVSAETAEAMAVGARLRTGATWAVSITGNAGPSADGEQAPVGMIHVGISNPRETVSFHRQWPTSDRARVRAFASQMALDLLHRKLNH